MSSPGEIPEDAEPAADNDETAPVEASEEVTTETNADAMDTSLQEAKEPMDVEMEEAANPDAPVEAATGAEEETHAAAEETAPAETPETPLEEEAHLETTKEGTEVVDSVKVNDDEGTGSGKEGDSSQKDETESVARSTKSQEASQPYSTRGRHQREAEEDAMDSMMERKSRDHLLGDDEKETDRIAGMSTSFLESLSEEDRRTRTRHLPDVEGFHELRKAEIKNDLALARSVVSKTGVTSTLSSTRRSKGKRSSSQSRDEDRMELDNEESAEPSEDERASDIVRLGGPVIDLDNKEFPVPSSTFVAPPDEDVGDVAVSVLSLKQLKNRHRSPHLVEGLSAFNPPRLPESIGAKKKHRMLRWERRPQDIDVDLANYKKTVEQTRQELRGAEKKRKSLKMVGAILRSHYREQLELLNEENIQLNEELGSVQTECVSAADLLTSRTRSRGTGKGSYLMRDVISIMKARGAELTERKSPVSPPSTAASDVEIGFGGITSPGFTEWTNAIEVPSRKMANGWCLPGDRVKTPYGNGVALEVYGPCALDVNAPFPASLRPKPAPKPAAAKVDDDKEDEEVLPDAPAVSEEEAKVPDVSHGFGASGEEADVVMATETAAPKDAEEKEAPAAAEEAPKDAGAATAKPSSPASDSKKKSGGTAAGRKADSDVKQKSSGEDENDFRMNNILAPRVCVQLQFGVAFFPIEEVTSLEDPSSYSDSLLASRWKKMTETALQVGSRLDVAGMESIARAFAANEDERKESSMDADEGGDTQNEQPAVKEETGVNADLHASDSTGTNENRPASKRFLPFGAGLLPSASGRGAVLGKAPVTSLETQINATMFDTGGVLGKTDNAGVPKDVRSWESIRQESYTLQSKVLQLRNELCRQRRIRALNERTYSTFNDRSLRAEALVSEMRADLKSLKDRLEDEVGELGIDGKRAEGLLTTHYKEKIKTDSSSSDAAPPKRKRRASREAPPPPASKMTRRSRSNSVEYDGAEDPADRYEDSVATEERGDSGGDAGNTADEEVDGQRETKRARYAQ